MQMRGLLGDSMRAIVAFGGAFAFSLALAQSSSYPKQAAEKRAPATVNADQQSAHIKASIARSPAHGIEAAQPTASSVAPPVVLHDAPKSASLQYRPLTGEQEREVHDLLVHQLKWPANDPEKERRTAVFKGIIQSALGDKGPSLKAIASEDAPMRFDPERKLFEGRIQVGFVELGESAQRPLAGNFAFQVQGPVTPDPAVARVDRTAPPFAVIRVSSNDPGPEVRLTVRSSVNPEGAQLTMKVVRPEVEVRVNPPRIQGLGLETADVVVTSKAPQVTRGLRIQLASDGGRVDPLTVVLDESGIATARIRSAAVGGATVRAEGPVIAPGAQASVALNAVALHRQRTARRAGRRRDPQGCSVADRTAQARARNAGRSADRALVFALFALGEPVRCQSSGAGRRCSSSSCPALGAFVGTRILGALAPASEHADR
jgi:hypothetical protein